MKYQLLNEESPATMLPLPRGPFASNTMAAAHSPTWSSRNYSTPERKNRKNSAALKLFAKAPFSFASKHPPSNDDDDAVAFENGLHRKIFPKTPHSMSRKLVNTDRSRGDIENILLDGNDNEGINNMVACGRALYSGPRPSLTTTLTVTTSSVETGFEIPLEISTPQQDDHHSDAMSELGVDHPADQANNNWYSTHAATVSAESPPCAEQLATRPISISKVMMNGPNPHFQKQLDLFSEQRRPNLGAAQYSDIVGTDYMPAELELTGKQCFDV